VGKGLSQLYITSDLEWLKYKTAKLLPASTRSFGPQLNYSVINYSDCDKQSG